MIGCATLLAIAELTVFALFVAGTHGYLVPLDHRSSTDFVSFYAAGVLSHAGTPWLAYDQAAHHAAEQAAAGMPVKYNYFSYPPVFLLVCTLLARLPYLAAFILFQAAGAAACFGALRLIWRAVPPAAFLAFPGVWWAFGTGQNALFTAALFAAGTALLERRPWLAGCCLGALCYKPDVGLLIPVALLAGGHWRSFLGAAGAVVTLTGASVLMFGAATWTAFLNGVAASAGVYTGHAVFIGGLTSPFGAVMTAGGTAATALFVQAAATVLAAACVGLAWRPRWQLGLPVRAAVLLAATPVAVPMLMFYDLTLVLVALVWIGRVRLAGGFPRWLAPVSAIVFAGPLLSGNLGGNAHWMVAFAVASVAFVLTLSVAWRALGKGAAWPRATLAPSES
jgi:hypothetical protein